MSAPAPAITSPLPDFRGVPLGEMPDLPSRTLDEAVQRVLPGPVPKVRAAKFNSAC